MSDTPDFTAEVRVIQDALAAAYRRGCTDTIARLVAGLQPAPAAPVAAEPLPFTPRPTRTKRAFPPRSWTEAENGLLISEWGKSSPEEIGETVRRSVGAVRCQAAKLGLPILPRRNLKEPTQ